MTDELHKLVPSPLSYSFRFSRREGWWSIYGHDGPGMRNRHIINPMEGKIQLPVLKDDRSYHFASKAEARQWARQHAARRGAEYTEWTEPPPPTPAEAEQFRINGMKHRIHYYDDEGHRLYDAASFKDCAEAWIRSASICNQVADTLLTERTHYLACAKSRIKEARRVLVAWGASLDSPRPAPRLKALTNAEPIAPTTDRPPVSLRVVKGTDP